MEGKRDGANDYLLLRRSFGAFPVMELSNRKSKENPVSLDLAVEEGLYVLQTLFHPIKPKDGVPISVLEKCNALVYVRVYKAGVILADYTVGGGFLVVKIQVGF